MNITVRPARNDDIPRLVELYREMEPEQTARKPIWALTDGLDERFDLAFFHALTLGESWLWMGTIEPMLERAGGTRIGRIRLIYTEPPARGVGVGHAMLVAVLGELRRLGIRHFDAPVGPGQRASKNFFEAHGFAARSIIMHHEDEDHSTDA